MLVHDFEKFMESPVLKQGYARAKSAPPPGRVWVAGRDTQVEERVEKKTENAEANGANGTKEEERSMEEVKEQLELTLMKEYRRKVHEMTMQERLDMQIKLVREIEGLSRQVAEKSKELSEIMKVL